METEGTVGKQNPVKQSATGSYSYTNALEWQIAASIIKRTGQNYTKVGSVQSGVKRFFDILDTKIDEVTRLKLLEENGRAWYRHLHTMPGEVMELGEFIKQVQRDIGVENCRLEGKTVFLNINQNKHNHSESDCYCLCPITEGESRRLSEAFCQCSIGYVCQMFLMHTGMKPEVELLESLKRGGKSCLFKITLT